MNKILDRFTPIQALSVGYIAITFIGAILLSLPLSSTTLKSQPFIDSFFVSASALTTTGLSVVDVGSYYSYFGQIIIILLMQIGGLGYMIFIALFMIFLKRRMSYSSKQLLHESINRPSSIELIKFSKAVIKFNFVIELIGAILLCVIFINHNVPINQAIYSGIFHSISAFCTAGFSIYKNSFVDYAGNLWMNLIISILSLAGALGFSILYELFTIPPKNKSGLRQYKLSVHCKFTLWITFFLTLFGTILIFFIEFNHESTFSTWEKFITALFQVVSGSSTAGFNSIDIGTMLPGSLFILIILMLIGASPGGTGGGIKTTTFGVLVLTIYSVLTGKKHTDIFKRSISSETINKSLTVGLLAVLWMTLTVLILTITENIPFLPLVFEASSAFATVGLSMGITASLSAYGKILISISMLFGRIGPLAVGFSLIGKERTPDYKYATGDILIG